MYNYTFTCQNSSSESQLCIFYRAGLKMLEFLGTALFWSQQLQSSGAARFRFSVRNQERLKNTVCAADCIDAPLSAAVKTSGAIAARSNALRIWLVDFSFIREIFSKFFDMAIIAARHVRRMFDNAKVYFRPAQYRADINQQTTSKIHKPAMHFRSTPWENPQNITTFRWLNPNPKSLFLCQILFYCLLCTVTRAFSNFFFDHFWPFFRSKINKIIHLEKKI